MRRVPARVVLAIVFGLPFVGLLLQGSLSAQSGRMVYERSCATCHGDAGQGRLAPALVPFTRGSQELLRIVRAGAGTMMNGFSASEVSDADVRAIDEYLRSLKPAAAAAAGDVSGASRSAPVVFGASAVPTAAPSTVRDKRRMVEWPFVGADQNNSRYSAPEIRELVREADVRVYAISLLTGSHFLERISEESGGRMIKVHKLTELPDAIAKLSRDLRSQYVLGYYPSNPQNDGRYRRVRVQVNQPTVRATWRRGYYAPAE